VLHKVENVTALLAPATIPHPLFDIDAESIAATASRARPN
jgi:hypothetical protein